MLTVGYELTGLELDAAGSARAARGLRRALEARDDVALVPLAQRRRVAGGRVLRGLARELGYFPLVLPRRARRAGVDLLHCPMPLAPMRTGGVPLAVSVHDMSVWDHPEWFDRPIVLQQRVVLARALRRAAAILVSSRFTRERMLALLDVDPEAVHQVPLGIDERFSPGPRDEVLLAAHGVEGPYVLAVGTLQPRKNLEAALDAFERLVQGGGEHRLVIAGARGWRDAELVARLERSPASARIHALGRVGDDALVGLYRGAQCLVYPSRYEGFGFPPLEAMACGTPVICSNRPCLPEVAGDAAELIDPDDPAALHDILARLIDSPARREELSERGLGQAARFTWERCAEQTVGAYREALARR